MALKEWVKPIAYCENNRYAQAVLLSRMSDGLLPRAPIWDDVSTLSTEAFEATGIDIVYGGFPCQDISVAGPRIGLEGKRSGLFSHIAKLTNEFRPKFVFLENVPGIRTRGLKEVIGAFTDLRYDCRWTVVSAVEIGASHLRKRWFLLAHNNESGIREQSDEQSGCQNSRQFAVDGEKGTASDTNSERSRTRWSESEIRKWDLNTERETGRTIEPTVCGKPNELPHRVDRIKGLGNAVVPLQARKAFMKLISAEAPSPGEPGGGK